MSQRKGPLERDIQRDVMNTLGRMTGVVVHRNSVGVARYETGDGKQASVAYGVGGKGAPDLVVEVKVGGVEGVAGMRSGLSYADGGVWLACWMETKTDVGSLSKDQRAWHEAAGRRGRHVFVVRTVDEALSAIEAMHALAAGVLRSA